MSAPLRVYFDKQVLGNLARLWWGVYLQFRPFFSLTIGLGVRSFVVERELS